MAAHSSVLAWRIPGIGEPGGLPSMGSHRVGHDWRDLAAAAAVQYLPSCLLGTCISLWTIRHMSVSEPLNNLELFPLDMHKSHFLSSSWGLDPNILSMKLCRTILNSNSWFVILLPGSIFFFFFPLQSFGHHLIYYIFYLFVFHLLFLHWNVYFFSARIFKCLLNALSPMSRTHRWHSRNTCWVNALWKQAIWTGQ